MGATDKVDLEAVANALLRIFPKLDVFEQKLSLELYRLLAKGKPVHRTTLAERLTVGIEIVNRTLDGWPGVVSDVNQSVVGYWGLSLPTAHASRHCITVNGESLSAWCAWDALFLPQLLGETVLVESTSPTTKTTVKLTVTPKGVRQLSPIEAGVSLLFPESAAVQQDIVGAFCQFVHFFPSSQEAKAWADQHPGTFVLSVAEAYAVARRKNEAQYGAVLA